MLKEGRRIGQLLTWTRRSRTREQLVGVLMWLGGCAGPACRHTRDPPVPGRRLGLLQGGFSMSSAQVGCARLAPFCYT